MGKRLARAVKQPAAHYVKLAGLSLPLVEGPMKYCIFTHSTGEPIDTVELHVLARAYCAAWRSMFMRDPAGPHVIRALDIMLVFE